MPDTRLNWSNRNSQRSFPIEELATKTADGGDRLDDTALSTIKVRFPDTIGERVCVAGITISPALATITLVATSATYTGPVPLGCLSVTAPVQAGKPYPITPMYPGVSGWVAFGTLVNDVTEVRTWKFSDPSESPVVPSEARSYEELPVAFVGKWDLNARLTGLVSLDVEGPLIIEGADMDLGDGENTRVIRLRMDLDLDPDVLYEFAGPCAGRPESQTCDFTPITSINSVVPNCEGDITLTFEEPFVASLIPGQSYLSVDFPMSMEDACDILRELTRPAADGTIPGAWEDICGETAFYAVPG